VYYNVWRATMRYESAPARLNGRGSGNRHRRPPTPTETGARGACIIVPLVMNVRGIFLNDDAHRQVWSPSKAEGPASEVYPIKDEGLRMLLAAWDRRQERGRRPQEPSSTAHSPDALGLALG